jgi:hypothetical protein
MPSRAELAQCETNYGGDWALHTRNSHNLRSEVDNQGRVGPVKISWRDRQEKNTEWWPVVESIHPRGFRSAERQTVNAEDDDHLSVSTADLSIDLESSYQCVTQR